MTPRSRRAFIARHTALRPVHGLEAVRLHLAWEAMPIWRATQDAAGAADAPIPFWAFAWAGGLAIGRYLLEHPEVVEGRRVLDFGSGSGLCAIAAMRAGALRVVATDIDPLAVAAVRLNAEANGVRVSAIERDVLDDGPPDVDVIIAGDCWYEGDLASRVMPWLERSRAAGVEVLLGDPGRRYLPRADLVELASYEVRTSTELEDMYRKDARVFALR